MENVQPNIYCQKCGSTKVVISLELQDSRTHVKKAGCLYDIGRIILICCTLGLWLIIGKKAETQKQKYTNKKVVICQSCGEKWYL